MNQTNQTEPPTMSDAPPPTEEAPAGDHPHAPPPPPPPPTAEQTAAAAAHEAKEAAARAIIPLEPKTFDDFYRWSRWASQTQFVPKEVRGRPNDVMYMVMMGHRWGLDIMASLQLHVIEGKVCLPAVFVLGMIQKSPLCEYLALVESTATSATWATKRRGGRREIQLDFTIEEAAQMGLLTKGRDQAAAARNQWNRQPRTMLRWRALSAIARMVFADLIGGLYTTEEMVDVIEMRGGQVVVEPVTKAEIDNAKDVTMVDRPALAADTVGAPPEMIAAMTTPVTPAQLEPVRLVTDRARLKAEQVRTAAAKTIKVCVDCGGPFEGPGDKCAACK